MHQRARVRVESVFEAQHAQECAAHPDKSQAGGHCIKLASLLASAAIAHLLWDAGQLTECVRADKASIHDVRGRL